MNTIRRIYLFTICFISLQWAALSIKALMDALLLWIFVRRATSLGDMVFPLAVIIVGGPVFLGHWLWAQWLAKRSSPERNSLLRGVYLVVTQSLLMAYCAVAVYGGVQALVRLLLAVAAPGLLFYRQPLPDVRATALAGFLSSLPTAIAILGLWLYHYWVIARDEASQPSEVSARPGGLLFLSNLGFAGVGMGLAAGGLAGLQNVLLHLPDRHSLEGMSLSIGLLVSGAALWSYHQLRLEREPQAQRQVRTTLRLLVEQLFSAAGLIMASSGVYGVLAWCISYLNGAHVSSLPWAVSYLTTGLALFIYHEFRLRGKTKRGQGQILRRLYAILANGIALLFILGGAIGSLKWLFSLASGSQTERIPSAIAMLAAGSLVWLYFELELERAPWRWLHALLLQGVGLFTLVVGLMQIYDWAIKLRFYRAEEFTQGLAWLVSGGLVALYYELKTLYFQKTRSAAYRWGRAQALTLVGLVIAGGGLALLQRWGMAWVSGTVQAGFDHLGASLAWLVTGWGLFLYYERRTRQDLPGIHPQLSWLTGWGTQGLGVLLAVSGLVQTLRWSFGLLSGASGSLLDWSTALLPGACLWLYGRLVIQRSPYEQEAVRRFTLYGFSALGVSLAAFGAVGMQEWLYSLLINQSQVLRLPDALATLIAGLPLWLYFWRWIGQLFASGEPAERRSDLRKVYLYLIIYITVNSAVLTIGMLMNGIFRRLLGLPTGSGLALLLSMIFVAVLLWAYHAWVLRGDIRLQAESSLQGGMQRLYWYLVAIVGLLAFVVGLSVALGSGFRLLAGGAGLTAQRVRLAGGLAAFLAGAPVWALAWFPAQRAAQIVSRTGEGDQAMRRSFLRKGYLYFSLLGATLAVLYFAIQVIFRLLNAIFGLNPGANLLAGVSEALGITLINAALWGYHMVVLREDGRYEKAEKEQEKQQVLLSEQEAQAALRQRWAGYRIVVVNSAEGRFGTQVSQVLASQFPHLNVQVAGGPPEGEPGAETVEAAAPPVETEALPAGLEELLAQASLVITPATAIGLSSPVLACPAAKLVVPTSLPGVTWVGLPRELMTQHLVYALRAALPQEPPLPKE